VQPKLNGKFRRIIDDEPGATLRALQNDQGESGTEKGKSNAATSSRSIPPYEGNQRGRKRQVKGDRERLTRRQLTSLIR